MIDSDYTSMELRQALADAVHLLKEFCEDYSVFATSNKVIEVGRLEEILNQYSETVPQMHLCDVCKRETMHTFLPLEGWMCKECNDAELDEMIADITYDE